MVNFGTILTIGLAIGAVILFLRIGGRGIVSDAVSEGKKIVSTLRDTLSGNQQEEETRTEQTEEQMENVG